MSSKAAIVTGASYGIGKGIAYALASKGYELLITHLIQVNYLGAILMSQQAAAHMSEGGSIVHITSTRAHRAYPFDSIYGSMKAALTRAAETMALEFAPFGIRVNCVAPGAIAREANTEYGNK